MTHICVASINIFREGRVILPAWLGAQHDGQWGDRASITLEEDGYPHITLRFGDIVEATYGMLAGGPDYTRMVVEEHARERKRERIKVRA